MVHPFKPHTLQLYLSITLCRSLESRRAPWIATKFFNKRRKIFRCGLHFIFHPHGEGVTVHKKNTFCLQPFRKPVLQGWRDANGPWSVSHDEKRPLTVSRSQKGIAASAYNLFQTIRYLHAAAGFPAKDTWIKAFKRNYKTWPGMTAKVVSKRFPESMEALKGHMEKQRKKFGQQSKNYYLMRQPRLKNSPAQPRSKHLGKKHKYGWIFCRAKLPIGSKIVMNITFFRTNLIKRKLNRTTNW